MMLDSCTKHPHEAATALCGRCGHGWCSACLVFAHGPKKPAFCLGCAMVAGGVKCSGALPAMPKRELKARMKALKAAAKAEAKAGANAGQAAAAPAEIPEAEVPGIDPVEETVLEEPAVQDTAAPTDWATPWWEDRQPAIAD
jgi:hypothetical protein